MQKRKQKGLLTTTLFLCLQICGLLILAGCDRAEKPAYHFEVATRGAYSAALSEDGLQALVGSVNHGASWWQVSQQERLYDWNHQQGNYTEVVAAAISGKGDFALTASALDVVLWDVRTGKSLTYFNAPAEILAVSLSRSGKYALLGLVNRTAVLMDVKKGGVLRTFHHNGRVQSVYLSADSRYAITGDDDYKARLWDVQKGKLLFTREHSQKVQLVRLSPDNRLALSVSKYDQALIWDVKTGQAIAELSISSEALKRGKSFTTARFSEDGAFLLTGSSNREVTLWDTGSMKPQKQWRLTKRKWMKPTGATLLDVAFAGDQIIAVGSNGLVYALDNLSL